MGNLAERMGEEIEAYSSVGYDVMLGCDMLQTLNRGHLEHCFWLHDRLLAFHEEMGRRFAVAYAVDTHDTGDPHLWGQPLLTILGSRGVLTRHFIARFLGCGAARRPKYEVMGVQDMSHGLYQANVREVNLTWVGDETHNRAYHRLEDLYREHGGFLAQGTMVRRGVQDRYAWWVIEHGESWLVAVVCWDQATIDLDLVEVVPDQVGRVVEYDFEVRQRTQEAGMRVRRVVSQPPAYLLFAVS